MSSSIKRIAMWSGPRNISKAMMRSWEARSGMTLKLSALYSTLIRNEGVKVV